MIEIKIPKYRTVQLVFTASQVHSDLKGTYLPPYYGNLGRSAVTQVNAGDYILTDQFGGSGTHQKIISKRTWKK